MKKLFWVLLQKYLSGFGVQNKMDKAHGECREIDLAIVTAD